MKGVAFKCDLPNYGVFDEKRVFEPGLGPSVFEWKGVKLGSRSARTSGRRVSAPT
uniref:Uncharacterized protein n=1 Tax=Phenylobacterium glaciei TaxID=2803784 RepID=A0A974SAC4_9CAUL|nr:hypothetical protein JKL49_13300 [Phenylobacterium glaciei]